MKIAVIISTYNGEKYLRRQLDSIIKQTIWECIDIYVRDDGSTDKTIKILDDYRNKGLLHYYVGSNIGPANSFLELLNRTNGYDFYAFSDQDDYWYDNKIETAVSSIIDSKENIVLYCSNANVKVDCQPQFNGRVYKSPPITDFYYLCISGGLLGCTMVFNEKLAIYIKKINISSPIVMHDFLASIICKAVGGTIIFDEKAYMDYCQHGNNVVGVNTSAKQKIKSKINELFKTPSVSIADQAKTILHSLSENIPDNKIQWLNKIANYKEGINRFNLIFNKQIKYKSQKERFEFSLLLLLGKR